MTLKRMVTAVGKSLEEAVQAACEELGVTEDQVDVDVIQDGTKGVLAVITGRKIKIRAILKPEVEREAPVGYTYYTSKQLDELSGGTAPKAKATVSASGRAQPASAKPAPAKPAPAKAPAKSRDAEPVVAPGDDEEEGLANPREVLTRIVETIQSDATVERINRKDHVLLRIVSDGSGIFIGNKGATLDALQYIVNKIVQRATGDDAIRVVVDSENYRQRKMGRIEQMADRLIQQAKRSGRKATSEPLNAFDRRLIHLAVKRVKGLISESTGSGELKRVQVIPEGGEKPRQQGAKDGDGDRKRSPRGSKKRGRKRSGRKPEFLEDRPDYASQVRGEGGFETEPVDDGEDPMPEMFVDRPKTDEE